MSKHVFWGAFVLILIGALGGPNGKEVIGVGSMIMVGLGLYHFFGDTK